MQLQLASRLATLAESQTLAMAKRVRELKAAGKPILSFTLGEPDFDTPLPAREAAKRAIDQGLTHYPPVAGIAELREAIAQKLNRENGLQVGAANIIVSTGAKQSLVNALMAVVNPGEEVLIPAPYWVSYLPMVQLAEGVPVVVHCPLETGLKLTPELLEKHITSRTKVLLLNSPSNPTGAMYSRAELEALAAVLHQHPQIWVLADEIYEYIRYGQPHVSMGSLPGMGDRTLTVNGFSKAYAMTGWRCGYLAGPLAAVAACEKIQGQFTSGTSSITQYAALGALQMSPEPVQHMVEAFTRRRNLAIAIFREQMPEARLAEPDGAFYLFPDLSTWVGKHTPEGRKLESGDDIALYLLEEANVATVGGTAFGAPNFIRLSFACDEATLAEGLGKMAESLRKLG